MKKNLISVVILALVFANFVLTAILMFTVLPEKQRKRLTMRESRLQML